LNQACAPSHAQAEYGETTRGNHRQLAFGKTGFRIDIDTPAQLTWCTCSFCAKRGALLAYCEPAQFHLTTAADDAVYRWQTKQVAHHFCPSCGCATYSDSPAFDPVARGTA
jgi:hypothetical protein